MVLSVSTKSKVIDIANVRFGRLIVIELLPYRANSRHAMWNCLCDCGQKIAVSSNSLKRGHTKSCGCLNLAKIKERMSKHGMYGTPEYRSWIAMFSRCSNPMRKGFVNYGGRGIKICKHWKNFENFYKDMGERPVGKSLDRKNNDGDYTPDNCRWATPKEQANNRRKRNSNKSKEESNEANATKTGNGN